MTARVTVFLLWVNSCPHFLKDVIMMPRVKYEEITQAGLVINSRESRKALLKVDTIVLAAGSNPNKSLYKMLEGKVPELYAIGVVYRPVVFWGLFTKE